jgi:hypothetical protein
MSRSANARRPRMTAEEARSFDRGPSMANMVALLTQVEGRKEEGLHPAECRCEPYVDFFTIRRWNAQGFRVRKGSKSFRLPIVSETEREVTDDNGAPVIDPKTGQTKTETDRHIATARVFCRCQVETSYKAAANGPESEVSRCSA